MRGAAAILVVVCACDAREPIDRCDANLTGSYATPAGTWMLLDNGKSLEGYPLFDDKVPDGAPRLVDLARTDGKVGGDLKRRFMRRADACESRVPFHVTACKADTLQIVLGDVTPPLTYAPCTWGQSAPTRVETWRRASR
jgi:hypothetical protein